MKDKIWTKKESNFTDRRPDSRVDLLLPAVSSVVKENMSILDFGCGEGYLSNTLPKRINLFLYDINKDFLELAKKQAENNNIKNIQIFENIEKISKNSIDLIVFSLVFITFSSKEEFDKTFKVINNILKPNGKIIIADTHPCFREKKFSTFYTNLKENEFNYFDNHIPFRVNLIRTKKKPITFNDFHYNLSFIFKLIISNGFEINEFLELKDIEIKNGNPPNKNYSPYYIIQAQKNK